MLGKKFLKNCCKKILDEMEKMEKNKEKIVQSLKLEKEKFGNSGVLKKISKYLLSEIQ